MVNVPLFLATKQISSSQVNFLDQVCIAKKFLTFDMENISTIYLY